MRRRKTKASSGDDDDGYEVGYGKPPLQGRFRTGQSGNPAGRPKGVRNLATDVRRTLATPVTVREGGRRRKKSTQEVLLMVLREKALQGNARALDRLLELALRCNNDGAETGAFQALTTDDQAILDAYVAGRAEAKKNSKTAKSRKGKAWGSNKGPNRKARK